MSGWYQEERGGDRFWRWSDGSGSVLLENPRTRPQRARLSLHVRAVQPCTLRIEHAGRELLTRALGDAVEAIELDEFILPPGASRLVLAIDRPAISPPGDGRQLALALYEFELESLPERP